MNRNIWLLLAIGFMALIINIDYTAVNLALVPMSFDLHATIEVIQWVLSGYVLAWAILVIPAGKTLDKYGARNICLLGLIIFLLGSILAGIATSSSALIFGRIIQGIAGAFYVPTLYGLISSYFSQEKRGFATGILSLGVGLGMTIGPTFGGWMVTWLNWRWIFLINIPFVIITLWIIYGLPQKHSTHTPQTAKKLYFSLLKNKNYLTVTFAFALEQYAFATLMVTLSLLLQKSMGIAAFHASLFFLVLTLAFSAVSPMSGKLIDRFGIKPFALSGMLILALTTFGLAYLPSQIDKIFIIAILLIMGIGMGLAFNALNSGLVKTVPESEVGMASSVFSMLALLGNSCGVMVSTFIYKWVSQHALINYATQLISAPLHSAQIAQAQNAITLIGSAGFTFDTFPSNMQPLLIKFLPAALTQGIHVALLTSAVVTLVGSYLLRSSAISAHSPAQISGG